MAKKMTRKMDPNPPRKRGAQWLKEAEVGGVEGEGVAEDVAGEAQAKTKTWPPIRSNEAIPWRTST